MMVQQQEDVVNVQSVHIIDEVQNLNGSHVAIGNTDMSTIREIIIMNNVRNVKSGHQSR